jgi:hypothetical protein
MFRPDIFHNPLATCINHSHFRVFHVFHRVFHTVMSTSEIQKKFLFFACGRPSRERAAGKPAALSLSINPEIPDNGKEDSYERNPGRVTLRNEVPPFGLGHH